MRDDAVTSFVERLGERLAAVIPPDLQRNEFKYTFETVNVREINAFALPGGPMFVNRGMIEAANSEGEVAGVMAHELSHVLLRHGTAQASKADKYQMGQVAGAVLGAIIGGRGGSVVAQGTQFGLGTAFLRFGREYERQADIHGRADHGARRLRPARHGEHVPDDRKAGRLERTRVAQRSPEPGQPVRVHREGSAVAARCRTRCRDTAAIRRGEGSPQVAAAAPYVRGGGQVGGRRTGDQEGAGRAAARPRRSRPRRDSEFTEGNLFRISVPDNWRELPGSCAVTFAPSGAFGHVGGQSVFTHGVEVGVSRNERHDLPRRRATSSRALAQSTDGCHSDPIR